MSACEQTASSDSVRPLVQASRGRGCEPTRGTRKQGRCRTGCLCRQGRCTTGCLHQCKGCTATNRTGYRLQKGQGRLDSRIMRQLLNHMCLSSTSIDIICEFRSVLPGLQPRNWTTSNARSGNQASLRSRTVATSQGQIRNAECKSLRNIQKQPPPVPVRLSPSH
jgi:hypothetical protein